MRTQLGGNLTRKLVSVLRVEGLGIHQELAGPESNKRAPDPSLAPITLLEKAMPNLSRVDEVGFSDLTPDGWIPATTRVN